MSNLINAWVTYQQKKAEFKARQKQELEELLKPYLTTFGEEILLAQEQGKRIEDIEHDIGSKNRTLVYAAKRLAKAGRVPDAKPAPEEPAYQLLKVTDGFEVYIDEQFKGTVCIDEDDEIEIPEEWALDADHQITYRQVVKDIRNRIKD